MGRELLSHRGVVRCSGRGCALSTESCALNVTSESEQQWSPWDPKLFNWKQKKELVSSRRGVQDSNAKVRGKGLRGSTREKECDFILTGAITELSCVSRNILKCIIHFTERCLHIFRGLCLDPHGSLSCSDLFCKMVLALHRACLQPPVRCETSRDDWHSITMRVLYRNHSITSLKEEHWGTCLHILRQVRDFFFRSSWSVIGWTMEDRYLIWSSRL